MLSKEMMKSLRARKGLTGKQVADGIGIAYPVYQSYESGARNAGLPVVEKLADFYGVTTDYLLGREGAPDPFAMLPAEESEREMLERYFSLPPDKRAVFLEVMLAVVSRKKETSPVFLLRVHRSKTAAGFGYDLTDGDEWTEAEVIDGETVRRASFAVEVEGDSMEPDFHDGDLALIQLDPDVPLGKVGLFVVDGKGYIKERGKRCLISRNPDYPNIEGEARCIGLVIGTAERA